MAIKQWLAAIAVAVSRVAKDIAYPIRKAWLKRQILVCQYRREEFEAIVRRERIVIDDDEHYLNQRLRELESDRLHRGLVSASR